ncbi:MAG: pseudouridine synthase [Pseudomonadota bacterium]
MEDQSMEERLQKILARAGVASRRAAEDLIRQGRVSVNGRVVNVLGSKADPARDDIRLDGERLRAAAEPIYLALNKPRGYVTTLSDPEGRPTVADLVSGWPRLFPVGRLDYDTEGLLIMTNDGEFAQFLVHPRYRVTRTYRAKVKGVPTAAKLALLERGVKIDAGRVAKAEGIRLLNAQDDRAVVEIIVAEGRQHLVKRMFMAIGHPMRRLTRLAIGPLLLGGLRPGAYRSLTVAEVDSLKAAVHLEGAENAR